MEAEANSVIQAIVIITSIFLLVAIFVISYFIYFNKRKSRLIEENHIIKEEFQRQLLQSRIEVQEHTFQQIGKELHDNVGQLLSSSRMLLGLTERKMNNPPDTLITANLTLAQAISELRSLSKSLDKEWLEQFRFVENMQNEVARINAGESVKALYQQNYEILLPPDKQIILFRIVQEAMQNAIKHATPKCIHISTAETDEKLCVVVTDDGKGFEVNAINNGMGLNNMRHRTHLLGGEIKWEKLPDQGTRVSILIPINDNGI